MDQAQALKILKTGANVFLTGEPGSGKTYVINQYVAYLRRHGIEPAITASTGIAATHIGGITIHSWSGIGIKNRLSKGDLRAIATNDYVKKRVGKAKILIIDEISMLSPETLQMIEAICREVKDSPQPFGGLQIILVGDFFQLPPVVKNYFGGSADDRLFDETPPRFAYEAACWSEAKFTTCYLTEQYRQNDTELTSLLSKIRSNCFDESALAQIQSRKTDSAKLPEYAPKLFSHNIDVDAVNDRTLAKIPKEAKLFSMVSKGQTALINAMKKGCLSPENLYLKVGASVMFTKNNQKEGFVNGTLGVVEDFDDETEFPIVKIRNGRRIRVSPTDWTVDEGGKVKGLLTQIPLRLAWAITVHKSQGVSLDEAIIDLSRVFEFGQGYVAISRVRQLSGLYVLGWNAMAFQVDPAVLEKDREFRIDSTDAEKICDNLDNIKLEKLQNEFVVDCGGKIKTSDVVLKNKKFKPSTYEETLKLWSEGKGVKQIAEIRHLNQATILGHVESLVNSGKIDKDDLARVVSPKLLPELTEIQDAFKNLDTDKLSPVFEHFQGKYSYDDIRLAMMMKKAEHRP